MVDGVLIMNIEMVKKQFVLFYPAAMEWIADNIKHIESYYVTFPHETDDNSYSPILMEYMQAAMIVALASKDEIMAERNTVHKLEADELVEDVN